MPEKKQPPIQQTAIGDGNVQVAGDNNTVRQEVTSYIQVKNELNGVNQSETQTSTPANSSQNINGNFNIQVVGDRNFIQQIINFFKLDTEQQRAMRNRRIMLKHVESFWVKGILEKSLHDAALLELGIKEDPDAVKTYPWSVKREATKATLPVEMSMLEIFQEIGMGRSLLILGAPGSGKTTMLLELTRHLIKRANQDVTEPIPIVFNLASWTEKLTLTDWLVRELNTIYFVPKKVALTWTEENKILLLLDGLDEVRHESLNKCVEEINQFREEHGLTSLAICSRIEEYTAINTKLSLAGAIALQPLTSKQINAYFDKFGKRLSGVKQLLKKNKALQELAEAPLMLSIMALAYKDKRSKELLAPKNIKERREHLFNTYIQQMFERPTRLAKSSFSKTQTLHYLHWLARMMIKHNMVTYQIEAMQPSWVGDVSQRRLYRLYLALIFGLSAWLVFELIVTPYLYQAGLIYGPMSVEVIRGLAVGLNVGLMVWLGDKIDMANKQKWSWKRFGDGSNVVLMARKIFGLGNKIYVPDRLKWFLKRLGGSRRDVGNVLVSYIRLILGQIDMVDKLKWSWKKFRHSLMGGVISGLIFGLFLGLISDLLIDGLIFGLFLGLFLGLTGGTLNAVDSEQNEETTLPGQRLRQTLFNALVVFLLVMLIFGLGGALVVWLQISRAGLIIGLTIGLLFGLSVALKFGILGLIQHYALRLTLIRHKYLPVRLIPFLTHAVNLIFLRRVGGSYTFIHRLLMEHFAAMYQEEAK